MYHKKHISIISLDFEKAFDKVGIHTILDQLEKWNIGQKMYNYIKDYLSKRKIIVRVKSAFSSPQPLFNGIPQGSPLSVILFLIAYDKLSNIINHHKELDFVSYADDFFIIKKFNKTKNQAIDISGLLSEIHSWCNYSGAKLSFNKCQHLHLCRKHNCHCSISGNNETITDVNSLKILGIFFDRRYNWHSHIEYLISSLSKRLNLIKCLSSQKYGCSTASLLHISNSLITSKINYGLYLYGHCSASLLKKIKTIYNAAIRMSLGAFRTSPINSMIFESGQMTIEDCRDFATAKLFKTIMIKDHFPLSKLIAKSTRLKYFQNYQSVLSKIVHFCKTHSIPFNVKQPLNHKYPNWSLNPSVINTSLNKMSRSSTNPIIFQTQFREIKDAFKDHTFIYTDGSKAGLNVAFSIIKDNKILQYSLLPEYSTNYSAEIIAIHNALLNIRTQNTKFAICTDSLSTIDAVRNLNNNNYYPNQIRQMLIEKQPNVKLVWIPGHTGIPGNELADKAAKAATSAPLFVTPNLSQQDIKIQIKTLFNLKKREYWNRCNEWYRKVNSQKYNTIDIFKLANHNILHRKDQIILTRLRLGHTRISHEHILDKGQPKSCTFCGQTLLNLDHIFYNCNNVNILKITILKQSDFFQLITSNISDSNTSLVLDFLKKINLYNSI